MTEIEQMSHVELLDAYDVQISLDDERCAAPLREEILRRMDSACTSRREEIRP